MVEKKQQAIENNYIRDCLGTELFPGQALPVPPAALDWERLYHLLARDRLSGHFFMLGQFSSTSWPDSFVHQLRLDYYQYTLYGDQCSGRVRDVLSALVAVGIPVIVMKGWSHIQMIYARDVGQRLCEDIDILVHPDRVGEAEHIFANLNWVEEMQSWPGYYRSYTNGSRYFLGEASENFGSSFSVGFHWGLLHIPAYDEARINIDALFDRARPLDVAGVSVLQLSVEDELVYLCGHVGLHHRFDDALFRYFELAKLIQLAGTSLDWMKVVSRAREWRYILPVKIVFRHVETLWPGIIPQHVFVALDELRPVFEEYFVNTWIEITRGRPIFDHPLTWLTFPRIWVRPIIMFKDIVPGPEYMRYRYGAPPLGWWPLLYFRRFVRAFSFLFKRKR